MAGDHWQGEEAGYSAQLLKIGGFTAKEMKEADFSAADLFKLKYSVIACQQAGFELGDLTKAGFSKKELETARREMARHFKGRPSGKSPSGTLRRASSKVDLASATASPASKS